MLYEDAKARCHVRSAIYRTSHPDRKFWKNHTQSLDERVPNEWKGAHDWIEHDPCDQ